MEDPLRQSPSTIGGFAYAASYLFGSSVTFAFGGARVSSQRDGAARGKRHLEHRQPRSMDRMLDIMREIAFRAAVAVGKDKSVHNVTNAPQRVEYQGSQIRSIYVTEFRYMVAAAILSLCSVFAVGATFYGWWELGRPFSMSPLELAKAFDAPVLKTVGEDAGLYSSKTQSAVLEQRIQYGEKVAKNLRPSTLGSESPRLVFAMATDVLRPRVGAIYGL
ncbi:hypothetical protein NX059_008706 [Plenodomus lindquistii]|nr:hypothetical protein NX059_008706 [Plenodomus lindquistii]